MQLNTSLWNYLLSGGDLAAALSGGFVYLYDGPVESDPDAALDGSCNIIWKGSLNAGATGLSFTDAASAGELAKPSAAIWSGVVLMDGTPTQARWCMGADNGKAAVSGAALRLCATAGDPGGSPEVGLVTLPWVTGNIESIDSFVIAKPA